ncbi:hypothetical protein BC943DRAFT_162674 [Umbelopsis sp. AD052]|nr:hypothetical protein BC943DRAFT_162674 [Umbelopsis sp. AD052]
MATTGKGLLQRRRKGCVCPKKPLLAPQAEPPHTPPSMFAPSSSNVSVKNIASELRPSLQQPLPLVHEEDEDYDNSPILLSSTNNPTATTVEDGSPPTPNSPILTTVVRDDPSTTHQASNSRSYSSPAHSYMELVDLRQQMSAIRLEREEWKERENQHRKREQEMLEQINRTQEQLQLALSSGGFLNGGLDSRPHTPEDEMSVLSPASKPNQLGPALEDGSVSDDREYYSLPPSRTRRERQELSDYADEPSEYSEEELPREYRRHRRSYHEDDEEDDHPEYFYTPSSRRSSRYYERPRSYEPEYERRRHHHRSYTPPSLDSDLSGDYSPEFIGSYSRRRDDDGRYDFVDIRGRELYSDEELPEFVTPRSRSRTPSRRSLSRNESINRNASRSGSRNHSRSASRSESRSQNRSRNSNHNLSRRSSSRRRHSSHHAPEDYYEQELYSVPRSSSRKHRRTRSSGSMRMPPPHPADMHFADWPDMHEPYYPMPEPHFPMHPPFHGMQHPAMASHMSLPELGMGHEPPQQAPPPPQAPVNTAPQQDPSTPRPANEGPMSKDGPRGILRKPSGSLHSMTPQRLPPQGQLGPQHPPFPMQHFGPPPPHMMGPMSHHGGPFPSPGMGGHMGFPPHGMFPPQGGPPPWHGQQQMQGGPMGGGGPPGRPSRKS